MWPGPGSLLLFGLRLAELIDIVGLGPISLFPCFHPFGLTDVVCLWACLCLPGFFIPLGGWSLCSLGLTSLGWVLVWYAWACLPLPWVASR